MLRTFAEATGAGDLGTSASMRGYSASDVWYTSALSTGAGAG